MNPTRVRFTIQDLLRGKASGLFLARAVKLLEDAGNDREALREAILRVSKMADLFIGKPEAAAIAALVDQI